MLLDSHAVLWSLEGDDRLGPAARRAIETSSRVYVSAASIWELTIKAMTGRIEVPSDLPGTLEEEGFLLLDVSAEHAAGLRRFPELSRHDPFDRLLVAQAELEGLPLLTADRVLLGLDRDFLLDATR